MDKAGEAARTLYNHLASEADENGVWRGQLIQTAEGLGISLPLYQRAISRLKSSFSIEVYRHRDFTEVNVLSFGLGEDHPRDDLTARRRRGTLQRRMTTVERGQIGGLNIIDEVAELKQRVAILEQQQYSRRDGNGD